MEIKPENRRGAVTTAEIIELFRVARAAADAGDIDGAIALAGVAREMVDLLPPTAAGATNSFRNLIENHIAKWQQ